MISEEQCGQRYRIIGDSERSSAYFIGSAKVWP
jgi:hypothetical protein